MKKYEIVIDTTRCIGCRLCMKTCVAHNIDFKNNNPVIRLDDCLFCGQCISICPKKAITFNEQTDAIEKKRNYQLNPNDVLNVIRFRRSHRHFQDKTIPKEIIQQILEAGRLTHTAENLQDVSFIVLDEKKEELENIAINMFRKIKPIADLFSPLARQNKIQSHFFFFNAPLVILILAKKKVNGLLAAQNMEFLAEAHGLGVLFSGYFTMAANYSSKIRRLIQLPHKKQVAMTLVLGYPELNYLRSPQRKKLDVKYM